MTNTIFMLVTSLHMAAIGQIENGSDDVHIHGRYGEVTRYQILPSELHRYGYTVQDVKTSDYAETVCWNILQVRVNDFIAKHGRRPTNEQVYLLWHRPNRVMKPKLIEAERAQRFANLLTS